MIFSPTTFWVLAKVLKKFYFEYMADTYQFFCNNSILADVKYKCQPVEKCYNAEGLRHTKGSVFCTNALGVFVQKTP